MATRVRIADTSWRRLVGLLDRSSLDEGEGLWIRPSAAIHTIGMRFAIDAVFLSRSGPQQERVYRVLRVYHRLQPWRMTRYVWGAANVLELPGGTAAASVTAEGDELEFRREGS